MQGAVIGAYAEIGHFCVVNSSASLDHESHMQDFSSMAPGAITGGGVRIGRRSAISIGAIIKHGVEIGDDVVIGAGSYVHESVPDGSVAFGTPATIRRSRSAGDPYLG
jgi:acetyltransferase-like isoleucine patch superfamily enzyme